MRFSLNYHLEQAVPVGSLLAPSQIHGFSQGIKGFSTRPLENYTYDTELSIDG